MELDPPLSVGDGPAALLTRLAAKLGPHRRLTFGKYTPTPTALEDVSSQPNNDLPDWPDEWGEFVVNARQPDQASKVAERALKHTKPTGTANSFTKMAEHISPAWYKQTLSGLSNDQVLALCSPVQKEGSAGSHLPLMDFRCPPAEADLRYLTVAMTKVMVDFDLKEGAILDSGRSYHFYGFQSLSGSKWRAFMAKCLLLAPYTDARYIGHRLLSGEAWLRLSTMTLKPKEPTVVQVLTIPSS